MVERQPSTNPAEPHGLPGGLLVGGAAASLVALGDFVGVWPFLDADQRLRTLLGLLAVLVPAGILVGAALGAVARLGAPATRGLGKWLGRDAEGRAGWESRLAPLPFVALGLPVFAAVAILTFSGGRASRLPAQWLLVAITLLLLAGGAWVAIAVGEALVRAARKKPATAVAVALLGLAAGVVCSHIDRHAYPTHYAYLHGALTFVSFASVGLCVRALAALGRPLSVMRARGASLVLVSLAAALLVVHTAASDGGHRVGATLFHPRAASSRSVLEAIAPMVSSHARASARAHRAADRRRAERRRRRAVGELPFTPGAHLLLITFDALRADHLGLYGYQRPISPGLDDLADQAVVFERAYAQAPHSSYSLSSLHTSEYIHEIVELGRELPEATLASVLRDEGYRTVGFYTNGIFYTEGERLEAYRRGSYGLEFRHPGARDAESLTDAALHELEIVQEMGEPPTFLWLHYFDAHHPYRETSLGTSDVDRYDGEVRNADRAIARFLASARARLKRPVVIAITADHGEEFGDHGGISHGTTLYEEQLRVPLLVIAPGIAPRRVSAPVELVDLAPTLLGLLGVERAPTMRGDDLRPTSIGQDVALGPAFAGVGHLRGAIDGHHKLIVDLSLGFDQLYDLAADPRERRNLADEDPARVDALHGEIDAWLDSLAQPPAGGPRVDPRDVALGHARMGDRRAIASLQEIAVDPNAPVSMRAEACRLLGQLSGADERERTIAILAAVLDAAVPDAALPDGDDRAVADEVAIALGRLGDERGRRRLRELAAGDERDLTPRAAVALASLDDRLAVESLVRSLDLTDDRTTLHQVANHLGRLGGRAAVEPLILQLPRVELAAIAAVVLGSIGDRRAVDPLLGRLAGAPFSNMRDGAAWGLGLLGDRRAIAPLVAASAEQDLMSVPEALVRLGAIRRRAIGGVSMGGPLSSRDGWRGCERRATVDADRLASATFCTTNAASAHVRISVPPVVAERGSRLIFSARRVDSGRPTSVTIRIGDFQTGDLVVDGRWSDLRVDVDAGALEAGRARAWITVDDEAARLSVDHLLLVPR